MTRRLLLLIPLPALLGASFLAWSIRRETGPGSSLPLEKGKSPGEASGASRNKVPWLQFEDIAPRLGLNRVLRSGSCDKLWILENVGTGCALFDADLDGLLDIFLANAGTVEGRKIVPGPGPAFYRQLPGGKFEDRTREAGLEASSWETGVAVGDMDNDGLPDLFVTAYGKSHLYRNLGGGKFRDDSNALGPVEEGFSTSAVFLDYDGDGFLDLFVANYVRFDWNALPNGGKPCLQKGVEVACGPGFFQPRSGRLYRNHGGARFIDVTKETGIARDEGAYGLGVAAGDLDQDGRPDIYVANDTTANFLWHNVDGSRFEDVALWSGVALSESGQGQAGMGVDIADADGDQRLDIFVTNYSEEYNAFYRNLGDGTFEDRSHKAGFAKDSFLLLGWGVKFLDLDNDGNLDLFVANGHVYPKAKEVNRALDYLERCLIYRNIGEGRFVEEGLNLGEAAALPRPHRGLSVGDIDNDGDLDILLTVLDGPPVLLRNNGPAKGNWISLRLEGVRSNREGIGAQAKLTAGGKVQLREVTRGGSYLSAQDVRLHFGLGSSSTADHVTIRWPSGQVDEIGPLKGGKRYLIVEGEGKAREEKTGELRRGN